LVDVVLVTALHSQTGKTSHRAEELDWSWVLVVVKEMPLGLFGLELLVGAFSEVHFIGGNNWFILTISALSLQSAHANQGDSTNTPLVHGSIDTTGTHAITSLSFHGNHTSSVAISMSKTSIEDRRECTTALITEEVANHIECSFVAFLLLADLEFFGDELSDESFGLNHGELYTSVHLTFKYELLLCEIG
jgi:hypothetical protein